MNKKIIATDFDGTFTINRKIPDNTRKNIARWRNAGNYFGFVTGRGTDFFNLLEEMNIDYVDFVIIYNGSLVCDIKGNIIHEDLIDRDMFSILEKEFEKTGDACSYDKVGEDLFYHHYYARYETPDRALQVATVINEKYGDKVTAFVNGDNVNIGVVGSGKAQGVYHILDFYGFSRDAAAVIGDDLNDIEMIKEHNGWAVKTARKEVLEIAPHICENVGDLADILLKENEKSKGAL